MGELVVVAGKVPRELRDKAKKYGINISRVIREALEKALRKIKAGVYLGEVSQIIQTTIEGAGYTPY